MEYHVVWSAEKLLRPINSGRQYDCLGTLAWRPETGLVFLYPMDNSQSGRKTDTYDPSNFSNLRYQTLSFERE